MVSGAVVVGCGDIIAQKCSPATKSFDYKRFTSMIIYGFLISGGVGHLWFRGLDQFFGKSMNFSNSVKKVCADQFLLAPPEIVFFLAWSHFSGESTDSFVNLLKNVMPSLLAQNYAIWIPGQFVNFYYVPEQHRVLFMCIICVFWFAILSFTSHEYDEKKEISLGVI